MLKPLKLAEFLFIYSLDSSDAELPTFDINVFVVSQGVLKTFCSTNKTINLYFIVLLSFLKSLNIREYTYT